MAVPFWADAVPTLDPHCLRGSCCLLCPWKPSMASGVVNFIRSIGRSDCRALLIPFLQVSSAVQDGWELASASPSSTRMQLPRPVAVPQTVPLVQPCFSWVSCKSGTHRWPWKTSSFPQFLSTYLRPDSQSVRFPLHCEMKERQGEFWQ